MLGPTGPARRVHTTMPPFPSNLFPRQADAFPVGGCVRDLLLGREPEDFDIAVLGDAEAYARRMARFHGAHLVPLGKPGHPLFRVIGKGRTFDIVPARGETIEADLRRRDFTINAMAYDLEGDAWVDPLGGRMDLIEKRVRLAAGGAFRDDPLRMVRAYRLAAAFGFAVDPGTIGAVRRDTPGIDRIAGERIRQELFKLLAFEEADRHLRGMAEAGLLQRIIPELAPLRGMDQGKHHRHDGLDHTLAAVAGAGALSGRTAPSPESGRSRPPDDAETVLLRWALLLHDIGKPVCRRVEEGRVRFFGHAEAGARMAAEVCRRLRLSNRETGITLFLVRNHIRPLHLYLSHKNGRLGDRGVHRFFRRCGEWTPLLLRHAAADSAAKRPGSAEGSAFTGFLRTLEERFRTEFLPGRSRPPLLTGHDLVRELGLRPGPLFKVLLARIDEERMLGRIEDRAAALKRAEDIVNALSET